VELQRRCDECKRNVPGHAGDACPYCGCPRLVSLSPPAPSEGRHHPSVVTAAVTFCVGLIVLRAVAPLLGSRLSVMAMLYGDLLLNLQMVIGACTVLFLILRRHEGDFRALFLVSFGLFVGSEGVAALSRTYGLQTLNTFSTLFNLALFIYSSLALTAAMADGPRRDHYQRTLVIADGGFMLLAALRTIYDMRNLESDERQNAAVSIILFVLVAAISILLVRAEGHEAEGPDGAETKPTPRSGTAPPAPAPDGGTHMPVANPTKNPAMQGDPP